MPSSLTRFCDDVPPRTSKPPAPSPSPCTPGISEMDFIRSFSPNMAGSRASRDSSSCSAPICVEARRWRAAEPVTVTSPRDPAAMVSVGSADSTFRVDKIEAAVMIDLVRTAGQNFFSSL